MFRYFGAGTDKEEFDNNEELFGENLQQLCNLPFSYKVENSEAGALLA